MARLPLPQLSAEINEAWAALGKRYPDTEDLFTYLFGVTTLAYMHRCSGHQCPHEFALNAASAIIDTVSMSKRRGQ